MVLITGVSTRVATHGDGEVIELDYRITVYPPREAGDRWRENGKRQQCESISKDTFAGKLEKVRQRLAAGASNATRMAGHANYRITLDMYVGTTAGVPDRARAAIE